ncbi:HD domain-containing phosphohydrolase [Shewanella sp. 10N.286.51.B2]|uniref:HD domain-containing phosphohydrolase n=1 Tax=Shewanella sp. 10N.286.51.B2 TaxID=3229707 RepID=UPI0035534A45
MINLHLRKSLLFGLIVFSFCISILYLDNRSEDFVIDKQKQLISENLFKLKKEHITDLVSSVHIAAEATLKREYQKQQTNLQTHSQQFKLVLNNTPEHQRCQVLQTLAADDDEFQYQLTQSGQALCQSSHKPSLHSSKPDNTLAEISINTAIADDMQMTLSLLPPQVINEAKKRIAAFIRLIKLQNPETYVWVNEVINYAGGDDFAIRKVHPSQPETEGQLLSTLSQDIKGNYPFQMELDGINAQGEVYFEYYFKRNTNDEIVKKLAYAKLYKPFDWIIATGVYVDDLEFAVDQEINKLMVELNFYNNLVAIIAIFLSVLLVICLYVIERNALNSKERELALKHKQQDVKNYRQVLSSMLDLVERRDSYTAGHTRRVAQYSVMIAKEMGFSNAEVEILYESAIMHDIGKISTPDSILLKPGKLTSQEYKIIQQHLDSGYKLLSSIKAFKKHAEIIRCHHEHYDGSGYPRGLKGKQICPLSHILILVDAFDAMTSKRIYKMSKSKQEAIAEIKALAGKQFCPDTVKAAVPVLESANLIPVDHNYLKDEFEEARLAYYYKDSLTGLYNYRYLEHVITLNEELFSKHYHCCYVISLFNFGQYNKTHGWLEGDKKLTFIANKLTAFLPESLIFRVFGNDFLILTLEHIELDAKSLIAQLELDNLNIELALEHINIDQQQIHNVTQFTEIINKIVNKKTCPNMP